MRYTAAAVQFEPQFGAKAENRRRLIRLVEEAAHAGARLIVLPEMATTGYRFRSRAEIAPLVEPVPGGETVSAFTELAARLKVYLVVGLPEVDPATGVYYNTAVLIGPSGYIGKYRKLHAFPDETRWAREGDLGLPVFETELGRIGLLICMDAMYPESARLAALAGADLIAFPTNWLGSQTAWYGRAVENGLYLVGANRWGEERGAQFSGNSAVIDPEGRALNLLSTGDGLCLATIDLEKACQARTEALGRRRPELYQEMLLHSHLWRWEEAFGLDLPDGRQVILATGGAVDPQRMADQARWADRQVRDRGMAGLDLMLFPFAPTPHADGTVARLAQVARDLNCHLAWGAPEPDGGEVVWLVGPEGPLARYQAVHPHSGGPAGADFVTVDLPWGRVGLATGADLLLPETARILSKRAADLILAPLPGPGEMEHLLWQSRWLENDTAIVVAAAGGEGAIWGSRPKATMGLDGVRIGTVDTGSPRIRSKELLRKLQPYWYGPLVSP